jgi:hypothetical protein
MKYDPKIIIGTSLTILAFYSIQTPVYTFLKNTGVENGFPIIGVILSVWILFGVAFISGTKLISKTLDNKTIN